MIRIFALSLLVAAPLSAPAVAAPYTSGSEARGGTAIADLENASRLSPRDGGALIELAQAYMRADRRAEARNAYRRALTLDNVMLETPTGNSIWAHAVARQALAAPVLLTLN